MRDIEHWPDWTPTVRKVRRLDKGPLGVGSRALIWQPKLPPAMWRVTELDDARRSFTWETRSPGMRLQARHRVEDVGNGSRATLSIQFSGFLGPLFARLTRDLNHRYLALEAKGLRECSEGGSNRAGLEALSETWCEGIDRQAKAPAPHSARRKAGDKDRLPRLKSASPHGRSRVLGYPDREAEDYNRYER
jgi:hypothetical protein